MNRIEQIITLNHTNFTYGCSFFTVLVTALFEQIIEHFYKPRGVDTRRRSSYDGRGDWL